MKDEIWSREYVKTMLVDRFAKSEDDYIIITSALNICYEHGKLDTLKEMATQIGTQFADIMSRGGE